MACCITILALRMDGPRITLILPPILSDPLTGMRQGGIRGINKILITGKIFSDSIPIGKDTTPVSVMTRIFIISTIVARVKDGIKDSVVLAARHHKTRDSSTCHHWAGSSAVGHWTEDSSTRYHWTGVRPATIRPGTHPPATTGPVHPPAATGPGTRPPATTGPVRPPATIRPGTRPATTGPVHPPGATGPVVRKPGTTTPGPGGHPQEATTPGGRETWSIRS